MCVCVCVWGGGGGGGGVEGVDTLEERLCGHSSGKGREGGFSTERNSSTSVMYSIIGCLGLQISLSSWKED